ncbi:hypothetical protein EIN_370170 [Entamoeba invadens IP1]|uniref:Uncharacterized protein n=1 Tax=Entamoeba invadens IP1 TaxID=370355 RepID=A0A0A1UBV2_ENTIV|nr:hypothetical protein EIN_370170 [Entamoeba invadens IP1]ELP92675.1 hypothetical protein EIN_370170 [Entamoeba invadens IP1]|eukprot:XP_004259446.1 hypothetical protein EIN_370170 [Entamoeba invadens IP1]
MTHTIKGIACDFGNVLFADGSIEAVKKLSSQYDKDLMMYVLTSKSEMGKRVRAEDTYWPTYEESARRILKEHDISYDEVVDVWFNSYTLNTKMLHFLQRAKVSGIKIIAYSGNIRKRVEFLYQKYPEVPKVFDVEVFSYDYNMSKENIVFTEHMVEKSGLQANEIVWIDDVLPFKVFADRVGVNFVSYRDEAKFIEQLKEHSLDKYWE